MHLLSHWGHRCVLVYSEEIHKERYLLNLTKAEACGAPGVRALHTSFLGVSSHSTSPFNLESRSEQTCPGMWWCLNRGQRKEGRETGSRGRWRIHIRVYIYTYLDIKQHRIHVIYYKHSRNFLMKTNTSLYISTCFHFLSYEPTALSYFFNFSDFYRFVKNCPFLDFFFHISVVEYVTFSVLFFPQCQSFGSRLRKNKADFNRKL